MATQIPIVLGSDGSLNQLASTDTLPVSALPSVPVYVQQTDPAPGIPYIWYQTDVSGNVIDILKG